MANMPRKQIEYYCSFCSKNQQQVKRLIAGPKQVYICDECIADFSQEEHESQDSTDLYCSFCGKKQSHVQHLFKRKNEVQICSECIDLCQEIIISEKAHLRDAQV